MSRKIFQILNYLSIRNVLAHMAFPTKSPLISLISTNLPLLLIMRSFGNGVKILMNKT